MSVAQDLRETRDGVPPIVFLTARPQDEWLATWAGAAAVVADPTLLRGKVVGALMRDTISAKGYHNLRFVGAYTVEEVASGVDAETGAPIEIPPTKDNRVAAQDAAPAKATAPMPAPVAARDDAALQAYVSGAVQSAQGAYDEEIPF